MFHVGDKVILNKNRVTRHVPDIKIDTNIHEIVDYELIDNVRYYVLDDFRKNFFTEDELLLAEMSGLVQGIDNTKQKMTLKQIENILGFEIELINDTTARKKKRK